MTPLPVSAQLRDSTTPLSVLADAARARMAERIEPPATHIAFLCLAERSRSAPVREYVLRQQAEAVQALLTTANSPVAIRRVKRLMDELARDGTSNQAAAWLTEQVAPGPARIRQSAAFGELPAALDVRMNRTCGSGSYRGLLGRTFRPLGEMALSDYQLAAEQAPSDPWTWLALAWLEGPDAEPALQRSLAAARALATSDFQRAQLFAQQELAWLRQQQGRSAEAQAAATEAMRLARQALERTGSDPAGPGAEQALRDLGQTGNALGALLQASRQESAARDVLVEMLPLQQRLAELRPDDVSAQYALIDTLLRLAALRPEAASDTTAPTPDLQAQAIYQRLQQRAPYDSMMGRSTWSGMFSMAAAAAGVLTLLLGLVLLRIFRRRVARLMLAAASKPVPFTLAGAAPEPAARRAVIEIGPPAPVASHDTSQLAVSAAAALRQAAVVQSVAGIAFGVVATWLQLWTADIEPNLNRFLVMSWTWAWPTVLALGLVWEGDRRRKRLVWVVYFAALALICVNIAMGDTPPMQLGSVTVPALLQGLVFWAVTLSYSPLLLLFLNRAVRAIGPALLAMMLVATASSALALVAAATPAGTALTAKLLSALHVPVSLFLPFVMLLGMLASAPLAWSVGRLLRAAYVAKWLTDQGLMIDAMWLFQASVLSLGLIHEMGLVGWVGLVAFGVYKGVAVVGMWPAARAARRRTPVRLLLLRVFGHQRSSERLFDLLGTRWRYAGPIHMIGAPDLASTTINPDEFLDFLTGRLRQRFILEPADLSARLAALDDSCDFDARWRVGELYCGNDTWREAVRALMVRSDVAAMDLRGFGPENQGCVFELHSLLDSVPVQRIALLVDASTKMDFLHRTVQSCLDRMSASSPNLFRPGHIALLDVGDTGIGIVEKLLAMHEAR